jgi:hypothetical protein
LTTPLPYICRDNFYECGIQNTSDVQIAVDWTTPFSATGAGAMGLDWFNVLGNHDYGYNPEAQVGPWHV